MNKNVYIVCELRYGCCNRLAIGYPMQLILGNNTSNYHYYEFYQTYTNTFLRDLFAEMKSQVINHIAIAIIAIQRLKVALNDIN